VSSGVSCHASHETAMEDFKRCGVVIDSPVAAGALDRWPILVKPDQCPGLESSHHDLSRVSFQIARGVVTGPLSCGVPARCRIRGLAPLVLSEDEWHTIGELGQALENRAGRGLADVDRAGLRAGRQHWPSPRGGASIAARSGRGGHVSGEAVTDSPAAWGRSGVPRPTHQGR
jgi:hypothetical protein